VRWRLNQWRWLEQWCRCRPQRLTTRRLPSQTWKNQDRYLGKRMLARAKPMYQNNLVTR
jgi:hypothetical protein